MDYEGGTRRDRAACSLDTRLERHENSAARRDPIRPPSVAKAQRGTIEERSALWGGDYTYRFDPARFRDMLEQVTMDAGYSFEVTLVEKSV